ncbi:SDR family NAD(P)-dependent oxidoreductase [Pseudonocardia acaciae]|uniref:SDR family NAD(P)-dependent oxidoreductase n=1 Tax=Pseudonocardia acaciae TaxID=551276 RepID=UPI00048F2769|nr:SDR family NAD(P)-dependent oxidoreductase [Pseudonocardia acaciae]
MAKAAVIVGIGPGLGTAVARRFAREGFSLAVIARGRRTVEAAAGVPVLSLTADATDEPALHAALDTAVDRFGVPDVVVYNAAIIQADAPGELSAHGHLDAWAVNVVGAVSTAARLLPAMAERGSGTFLITGGMPEPKPDYLSLSLGKAGVRALASALDTRYRPDGVHVGSVTVHGPIAPGTAFDPDDIAEHYWRLHTEEPGSWRLEAHHTGQWSPSSSLSSPGSR